MPCARTSFSRRPDTPGVPDREPAGALRPGRFLTYERWTDHAALEAHMNTPTIQAIVPKLGDVLARPFTQIFLGAPSTT